MSHDEQGPDDDAPASLVDALLVYVESLASGAHVGVFGNAESVVARRLLDLGARNVHVFDPDPARAADAARTAPRGVAIRPLAAESDVRDGSFDVAIVPDLSDLSDPRSTIARIRRVVASRGSVVAMGRAKLRGDVGDAPFVGELGPAVFEYTELYDVFATQYDDVSLAGVVPFRGVVFAELGGNDDAPPVSVDTRLSTADAPSVFVVVASQRSEGAAPALDPYAIVQVPEQSTPSTTGRAEGLSLELEAAFTAAELKTELLSSQLDEAHERLVVSDVRAVEAAARLDRTSAERDGALARVMEFEVVLSSSQQMLAMLEQRCVEAERAIVDRDDRIEALRAELHSIRKGGSSNERDERALAESRAAAELQRRLERAEAALSEALAEIAASEEKAESSSTQVDLEPGEIAALVRRAEHAEAALALSVADLAHVADAHAAEAANYEAQLRDRARFVAALEKELARREQLVKELVASLDEARESTTKDFAFESAAPMSAPRAPRPDASADEEVSRLRRKLDELSSEVARRDGELVARAWRISELENDFAARVPEDGHGTTGDAENELSKARDELDVLRQALTQEHAARVAAESGEELARVRSELARQTVLIEQMEQMRGGG